MGNGRDWPKVPMDRTALVLTLTLGFPNVPIARQALITGSPKPSCLHAPDLNYCRSCLTAKLVECSSYSNGIEPFPPEPPVCKYPLDRKMPAQDHAAALAATEHLRKNFSDIVGGNVAGFGCGDGGALGEGGCGQDPLLLEKYTAENAHPKDKIYALAMPILAKHWCLIKTS